MRRVGVYDLIAKGGQILRDLRLHGRNGKHRLGSARIDADIEAAARQLLASSGQRELDTGLISCLVFPEGQIKRRQAAH